MTSRRTARARFARLAALLAAVAMLAGATCPPESAPCTTVACCPRQEAPAPSHGCCPSSRPTPDQDQGPTPSVTDAHGLPVAGLDLGLLPLPVCPAAPHAATLPDRPSHLLTTHLRC